MSSEVPTPRPILDPALAEETGPTTTRYQQLADALMKEVDALNAAIPNLEIGHARTNDFVRTHLNVPLVFLATAISTVEQSPELQFLQKLDTVAARDTLQFIEAFRPAIDRLSAFLKSLEFTMNARRASLTADALQVYAIAQAVSRDASSAALGVHAANLKRDLGRRGPKGKKGSGKTDSAKTTASQPVAA